jgi:hypothetical protein
MSLKQCKKCPWKVSTNPHDIPNGYCETLHRDLERTIAKDERPFVAELRMMACHESPVGQERECVGWVANQLGTGNNIALRMLALDGRYAALKLDGPQHETFEDTLP